MTSGDHTLIIPTPSLRWEGDFGHGLQNPVQEGMEEYISEKELALLQCWKICWTRGMWWQNCVPCTNALEPCFTKQKKLGGGMDSQKPWAVVWSEVLSPIFFLTSLHQKYQRNIPPFVYLPKHPPTPKHTSGFPARTKGRLDTHYLHYLNCVILSFWNKAPHLGSFYPYPKKRKSSCKIYQAMALRFLWKLSLLCSSCNKGR